MKEQSESSESIENDQEGVGSGSFLDVQETPNDLEEDNRIVRDGETAQAEATVSADELLAKINAGDDLSDVSSEKKGEVKEPEEITTENYEDMVGRITEMAERKFGVPVLSFENIDEVLGDGPYLSHSLVSNNKWCIPILEQGALLSSEAVGHASMTYESDKLIGMHKNIFLALGKSYMSRSRFAFVFDLDKLAKLDGATFVENDLMEPSTYVISDFLESNKDEIVRAIRVNKDRLNSIFKAKVLNMFGGGVGIYSEYFGDSPRDRVEDFLKALETSSFKEIESRRENVLMQFNILSDSILVEGIMPSELKIKLEKELKEKVIDPNTTMGEGAIDSEAQRIWESDASFYKDFLPSDRSVPEKITEVRIPDRLNLEDALVGIYVPSKEDLGSE